MKERRTIGVFTGTQAEYGLLYPVIQALHTHPNFDLALYVSGAHLDETYGKTLAEIEQDHIPIQETLALSPGSMAYQSAELTGKLARSFETHRPDCLVVLGDRFETLGAVTAAFLSNIPIAHLHGGDVVGASMLDDAIRHAITKLAHLHFPVSQASANRILKLGEEPWRVHVAGSPAVDNMRMIDVLPKQHFVDWLKLDPKKPWILFTQHPITTAPQEAGQQMHACLSALANLGDTVEIIATYPNQDEGSAQMIAQLEAFATRPGFHVVKSLGRVNYLNILRYVALMAGNSSSGLLESGYFKLPCLNIGPRQHGRERGGNVLDVQQNQEDIEQALRTLLKDPSAQNRLQFDTPPFGSGHCAQTVIHVLENTVFDQTLLAKQLTY